MDEPEEVKKLKTELMKIDKETLVNHVSFVMYYGSFDFFSDETIKELQALSKSKAESRKLTKLLSPEYWDNLAKKKKAKRRVRKT